jgi:hypothetical protein
MSKRYTFGEVTLTSQESLGEYLTHDMMKDLTRR